MNVNRTSVVPIVFLHRMEISSKRLRDARIAAGFETVQAAADRFGWNRSTYASHENGQTPPPRSKLPIYAKAFKVKVSWLLGEDSVAIPETDVLSVRNVPVRGEAQAGRWTEFEEFDEAAFDPIPSLSGGKFSHLPQFAYKVRGASINKLIPDGQYAICVPYFDARQYAVSGDFIVVERHKGQTMERTVKKLTITETTFELWPFSTDPRFDQPISITKNGNYTEDDGTTVIFVGLVIGGFNYVPIAD